MSQCFNTPNDLTPSPRRHERGRLVLLAGTLLLGGCRSTFTPLQTWKPSGPATRITWRNPPFTAASRDPNQTSRYVYMASYNRAWRRGRKVLTRFGWRINEHDYRLGVIITHPLIAAQLADPWKRDQTSFSAAINNTINLQRYIARLRISRAKRKGFLQISVQVAVQRLTNPTGSTGGPAFAEGSGFGANPLPLQSSYVGLHPQAAQWYTIGRNTALERKILNALLRKI